MTIIFEFKSENISIPDNLEEIYGQVRMGLENREQIIIVVSSPTTIEFFNYINTIIDSSAEHKDHEYMEMFRLVFEQVRIIEKLYIDLYLSVGLQKNNIEKRFTSFKKSVIRLRDSMGRGRDAKRIAQERLKIMNFNEIFMSVLLYDFLGSKHIGVQWISAHNFIKNKGGMDDINEHTLAMNGEYIFNKEKFDALTMKRFCDDGASTTDKDMECKVLITQNYLSGMSYGPMDVLLRSITNKISFVSDMCELYPNDQSFYTAGQRSNVAGPPAYGYAQGAGGYNYNQGGYYQGGYYQGGSYQVGQLNPNIIDARKEIRNALIEYKYVACRNDGVTVDLLRNGLCVV